MVHSLFGFQDSARKGVGIPFSSGRTRVSNKIQFTGRKHFGFAGSMDSLPPQEIIFLGKRSVPQRTSGISIRVKGSYYQH